MVLAIACRPDEQIARSSQRTDAACCPCISLVDAVAKGIAEKTVEEWLSVKDMNASDCKCSALGFGGPPVSSARRANISIRVGASNASFGFWPEARGTFQRSFRATRVLRSNATA